MLKQKNLIFVGAPGAGKGTFSALLLERHPMAHISTGDILRDEVKRDTELGREAAKLMKEGKLVPDDVIAGMVRERLAQPDCDNGFILDGFPRPNCLRRHSPRSAGSSTASSTSRSTTM